MFLEQLSGNLAMKQAIAAAAKDGMPMYAECGGLMYLCRQIVDFAGQAYDLANVIPAVCAMQTKLETVGYVETTSLADTILTETGDKLRGHEFHFSRLTPDNEEQFPWAFEFFKARTGHGYQGGYAKGNILASYLHIHFLGNNKAAERFISACRERND